MARETDFPATWTVRFASGEFVLCGRAVGMGFSPAQSALASYLRPKLTEEIPISIFFFLNNIICLIYTDVVSFFGFQKDMFDVTVYNSVQ